MELLLCSILLFRFVVSWQLRSMSWVVAMSMWYYLSANARLSCQEIKPTQCTFLAKNYVKFFLLCFVSYLFQYRSSTTSFVLPASLASISVPAGPAWLCFAKNNVYCFCQEPESTSFLQSYHLWVFLHWIGNVDESQVISAQAVSVSATENTHIAGKTSGWFGQQHKHAFV